MHGALLVSTVRLMSEPRQYLVAAVQLCATSDKRDNLDKTEAFVRQAALQGARLVALPEVFFWRGRPEEEWDASEPIPGPTLDRLAKLAQSLRIHLLAGSVLERVSPPRPYNTSVLLGPDGAEVARYRKIHLFDVHVPGRVEIQESLRRRAGDAVVVASTPLGRIALAICYDLRFPELFRLFAQRSADVVLIPSAFTFVTGAAHWEPLLRTRAIENQTYVVAPNQIGRAEGGVENFGHSMVVDPWGTVLAQAPDRECVIYAEVDLDHLARVRRELPVLDHRRLPLADPQQATTGADRR